MATLTATQLTGADPRPVQITLNGTSADRLSMRRICDPADTPFPPGTAHDEPSAVVPRTSYV